MTRIALILTLFLATGTPASAAEHMSAKPARQGICELICQYKEGAGPKRIVTCTERMTESQCKATADHKNTSDAYPNKMSCAAKLVEMCEPERAF